MSAPSHRYIGIPIKDNSFEPEIGKYPDKLRLKYFEAHLEHDPRVHPYLAIKHPYLHPELEYLERIANQL
jgi:hypothetical protein